ncbi:MAG: endoglucanase, partial [Verrucomicrobiales bacterium]|nr:endoglucanase [Verrucomicrobiales bacterium]
MKEHSFYMNYPLFRRYLTICTMVAAGSLPASAQTGLPVLSISPARVAEGRTGEQTLQVPLFLSAPSASQVTVAWSVSGGTAQAGSDFSPGNGTVVFAPGAVRQTIPLTILGDTLDETDETIILLLTIPSGAVLGNDSAEVRIANDEKLTAVAFSAENPLSEKDHPADGLPSVSILNPQPGRTVESKPATPPGSATPDLDFTSAGITMELTAARLFPSFTVIDDVLAESEETVSLLLTNPGPSVFIQPRNPSQTLPAGPVPGSLAVDGDVMAAGGADGLRLYFRQGGQWSLDAFLNNNTGGVFSVAVDRGIVAADFADSGVKILVRTGAGAWTEEALIPRGGEPADSRRVLAMRDEVLVIGDPAASGQTALSGEVRVHGRHIGGPSAWGLDTTLQPVGSKPDFGSVVALQGTAVAVGAPSAYSVSLFERSPLTNQFSLAVEHIRILQNFGRSIALNNNTLVMTGPGVLLTSRRPDNATGPWTNPIQQQTLPQNQFVTQVFFQNNVLWSWHTTTGLRSYVTGNSNVWVSPGTLPLPATPIPANRRLAMSDSEAVVTGTEADGMVPLLIHRDATHNAVIVDDESLMITIPDLAVSGGVAAMAVTLSKPMPIPVTVECVPMEGTATPTVDYNPVTTFLTIPAGNTIAYIGVETTAPEAGEPVEFFRIKLQNPSAGAVGPDATVTIQPPFPTVNMTNFSYDLPEGNSGSTTVTIHVNLSAPAAEGASFNWIAENGGATAGTDFPATSGTVNLATGATTATLTVSFFGDITPESDEYFAVRLTDLTKLSVGNSMTSYVNMANDDIGTVVADTYNTPQNTPLTGMNVRTNDLNVDLIQVRVTPQNGGLAPMASGAFVYTPNTNFRGTDSFTYSNYFSIASGVVTTTVTINVTDSNIPPVLKPDNYTVREDTLMVSPTTGGLLNNDSLFNSSGVAFDPILEKEIIDVTNGTVSNFGNSNGTFNFMPAPNFSGIATFSYRVRDKDGWSQPALVKITVTDDFAMSAPQRVQPLGSQLFRSTAAAVNFPLAAELDWPVKLKAGQTVSMRAGTTGTLSVLEIRDSTGAPLIGGISGVNSLEHIPIPADGTYLVVAGRRSGGGSGPFLFVVNGGAAPSTSTSAAPYDLDAGLSPRSLRAAVAAVMPNTVAANHYAFQGSAGETVRIHLHSTLAQSFTIQ